MTFSSTATTALAESFMDEYLTAAQAAHYLAQHIKGIDTNYLLADLRRGRARRYGEEVPFRVRNRRVYYRRRNLLPLIESNQRLEPKEKLFGKAHFDAAPVVLASVVSDHLPAVSMALGKRGFVIPADEAERLAYALAGAVKEARSLASKRAGKGILSFLKKSA